MSKGIYDKVQIHRQQQAFNKIVVEIVAETPEDLAAAKSKYLHDYFLYDCVVRHETGLTCQIAHYNKAGY